MALQSLHVCGTEALPCVSSGVGGVSRQYIYRMPRRSCDIRRRLLETGACASGASVRNALQSNLLGTATFTDNTRPALAASHCTCSLGGCLKLYWLRHHLAFSPPNLQLPHRPTSRKSIIAPDLPHQHPRHHERSLGDLPRDSRCWLRSPYRLCHFAPLSQRPREERRCGR